MNNRNTKGSLLGIVLCALNVMVAPAWAEECVPETTDMAAVAIPDLFPASIPLPEGYRVMNASAGAADEYNPYPFAMLDLVVMDRKTDLFDYYQQALPAAGYRIVMWENDDGATGLRIRGDGIDQASFAFYEYDCHPAVSVSVSLLP